MDVDLPANAKARGDRMKILNDGLKGPVSSFSGLHLFCDRSVCYEPVLKDLLNQVVYSGWEMVVSIFRHAILTIVRLQ